MTDTETTFTVSAVYVRQVKETSFEKDASGAYNVATELPGFLEVCIDVNGVPWVIARRKAPGLLADIVRKQAEAPPVVPTPTPTAAQV
jgi:hypothetical protein